MADRDHGADGGGPRARDAEREPEDGSSGGSGMIGRGRTGGRGGGDWRERTDLGDRNPSQGFTGGYGGAYGASYAESGGGDYAHGRHGGPPRDDRRSDERIGEEVSEALTRHPAIDASGIAVRVVDAEVTLEGEVEDRRARRLAEDIAEQVRGVSDVHNHLHARRGLLAGLFGTERDTRHTMEREVDRTAQRERGTAGTGASGAGSSASGSEPG